MTVARQVVAGRTYLISRRCTQRQLLLRPGGTVEQIFTLRIERPDGFDALSEAEWVAKLEGAVRLEEERAREDRRASGHGILGRKAVLRAEPTDSPKTIEPRGGLRPTSHASTSRATCSTSHPSCKTTATPAMRISISRRELAVDGIVIATNAGLPSALVVDASRFFQYLRRCVETPFRRANPTGALRGPRELLEVPTCLSLAPSPPRPLAVARLRLSCHPRA